MARLINTKRLAFAIIMGTLGLVMQAIVPGIPLGVGGAKLELADIPVVLGASITGPVGGIICGSLYGIMSTANLALFPTMIFVFGLLGYLTNKRSDCLSVSLAIIGTRVILGPVLLAVLMKWIYFASMPFIDVWVLCLVYAAPGAVVSIGIYALLQKKIHALLSILNDNKS
jgi:hypothetical protein